MTTQPRLGALPPDARTPGMRTVPLDVLRSRTREAHQELDDALTAPAGRIADAAGYLRLLATLSALHARTDEPLRAWVGSTPWVRRTLDPTLLPRRSDLYASDLAALGQPRQPAPAHPVVCDDARGLGYLYVVAGSIKGARVVLHQLPDDLAPHARRGLADASDAGARLWRDCRAVLTTPLPEELVARAAEEAQQLFGVLLSGLHRGDVHEERAG